jgi:hypothetical protein
MKKLREEISKIFRDTLLNEEFPPSHESQGQHQAKSGPRKVRFNKGLENEYLVTFSERGFLIGNTRMSFEELKHALSKRYTITLDDGTILDAVKMQQILKYEEIY